MKTVVKLDYASRAPQGARGLKSLRGASGYWYDRRAPQGARGLKSVSRLPDVELGDVAPRKGRVG